MKMSTKELRSMTVEIDRSDMLEVGEWESNENWEWVDIKIIDEDDIGASESALSIIKEYGFAPCGVDMEKEIIRVNRKL